jgi:hypothetical protein
MPCYRYLIPCGDTFVAGGSYLNGDVEASIRSQEAEVLHCNGNRLGIVVVQSKPMGRWFGFQVSLWEDISDFNCLERR